LTFGALLLNHKHVYSVTVEKNKNKLALFTHRHAIQNPYDFLFSVEH